MYSVKSSKFNALVLCVISKQDSNIDPSLILEELKGLSYTLSYNSKIEKIYKISEVQSATYIGKGKIEELKQLCIEEEIDVILSNIDISATQHRNLEKILDKRFMEWSEIILEIFANNAKTRTAKTQVEIARLNFALPRLTRQWTHLERQRGGVGIHMKGVGEQQLELDRRVIKTRLAFLNKELTHIQKSQKTQRSLRSKLFRVAIVGYTNAGKSTLLKALTGADTLIEDRLFATLDSKARILKIKDRPKVVISDTVGFIRNLPHSLIASFYATLEEVREADLLIHIIDINDIDIDSKIKATKDVLQEIQALQKPIIYVFNKIDKLNDDVLLNSLKRKYSPACSISALDMTHIEELKEMLFKEYVDNLKLYTITVEYKDSWIINKIKTITTICEENYNDETGRVTVKFKAPNTLAKKLLSDFKEKGIEID